MYLVRQCAVLSTAVTGSLLFAPVHPADAISGGRESVGIFKPLDDGDLSGKDLRKIQFNKASLRRVKFDNADLSGTSMFGALCSGCTFKGANLRGTSLESMDLEAADFTNAVLEAAQVTNAQFSKNTIDGSDWTDVLLRKDQNRYLCSIAKGTNPETGVDTRESLNCP